MSILADFQEGTAAANTAVVITVSGTTDKRSQLLSITFSYDSTTPTGTLKIESPSGTTHLLHDVKIAMGQLIFDAAQAEPGDDIVITLGAGGAGIIGQLTVEVAPLL